MKTRLSSREPLRNLKTMLPAITVCFFLAAAPLAPAVVSAAEPVIVTEPLMRYGLGSLEAAAMSPDQRFLATAGNANIVIWNAATLERLRLLPTPGFTLHSLAFSPDGTRLIGASHHANTAWLWDLVTGDRTLVFSGHVAGVSSVAFSADGTRVATGSWDYSVRLWNADTGALARTFWHTAAIRSVAFCPSGARIVAGCEDNAVKIWNTATGQLLLTYSNHTGAVLSVVFSSDGLKVLSGGNDYYARLWNASTGESIQALFAGAVVRCAVFSPDESQILMGDWTVRLWDVNTGDPIREFAGHSGAVFFTAFSSDRVLTAGEDYTIRCWNPAEGGKIRSFSGGLPSSGFGLHSVAISADGTKVLAGSGDQTARLWNAETEILIRTLTGHTSAVSSVAFSPDGTKILTGSHDSTAKLWNTETGAEIRTFSGHTLGVFSVAFSPDGTKILTGSHDSTAKLWNTETGAEIRTFSFHTLWVFSVAFSPDGTKILTGSYDNTARLWNAETGTAIRTFSGHMGPIYSIAFSPDGTKILTGSHDSTAKLWNAETGTAIRTFSGHMGSIYSIAFSPDGTKILTGSGDNTAKLWDTLNDREIHTFRAHTGSVISVAFSPDGTKILTGADYPDKTAKLWDIETGLEKTQSDHSNPFITTSLSPDGSRLLTLDTRGLARLWQTDSGEEIEAFRQESVTTFRFSPVGSQILTGTSGGGLRLSRSDTGEFVRSFEGHTASIQHIAFAGDSPRKILATATNGTARIWSILDPNPLASYNARAIALSPNQTQVLTGHSDGTAGVWAFPSGDLLNIIWASSDPVDFVAFSPDGVYYLTGSGVTTKLWSAETSLEVRSFQGKPFGLSPDGRRLHTMYYTHKFWNTETGGEIRSFSGNGYDLSSNWDLILLGNGNNAATIWNTNSGEALRTFQGNVSTVQCVALSGNGSRAVTGGADGQAFLWDTSASSDGGGTPPLPSTRQKDKLLLVAGGGNYTGNAIASQTRALAELAYRTAVIRGYSHENIRYLSAFDTRDSNPLVDAEADADAIVDAVRNWSADAARLTVMLLDHGTYSDSPPEWYFIANGTRSPQDFLSAGALAEALDAAQSGADPLPKAIVYVEMCYAGGFVTKCSGAPTGTKRLVIASTSASRLANFGGVDGAISFTAFFLSAALQGNTLAESFAKASEAIAALNVPAGAPQSPLFDDDGDGLYTIADGGVLARREVFGNVPAFGLIVPAITDARPSGSSAIAGGVEVWCELAPGVISRVEAVISYNGAHYPAGLPVTQFTILPLAREGETNRWSATAPSAAFPYAGDYTILYTAYRDDGFGVDLAARPVARTLTVGTGAEAGWNLYE